jgi:YYY domain-containing protein
MQTDPIVLDQPVGSLPVVDDGRWSAALTSHSWAALGVWVVLLVVLQVVSWPLVRRLFPGFPDRGWGFARLVSLLLAGGIVWYGASLKAFEFRAIWCAVALVVVGLVAFGLDSWLRRGDGAKREAWYRQRYIVTVEVVFWAFFGLFLLFRLLNPDSYHPAWGGEKPMEFAHINAILRSAHFPPYDPWYADGLLNYYYYGMYLVAFMMKVTGIPTEIAFNLAQPTIIAFLASGVCGVVMALGRAMTRRTSLVAGAGLVGVLLVNVSGNLVVAARALAGLSEATPPLSDFNYWFWGPTRIVQFTINEFPWFTATYADLHAHVVAFSLTVLLIGLAFSLLQSPRVMVLALGRPRSHRPALLQTAGCLALSGITLGSLYMTNAWDVPSYAALTAVAVLLATRAIRSVPLRLAATVGMVAGTGLLAVVMAWPFVQNYVALYGEVATTTSVSAPIEVMSHFGHLFLIVAFGLSLVYLRTWTTPGSWWLAPVVTLGLLSLLMLRWYGVEVTADWVESADTGLVAAVALWFVFVMARPQRRDYDLFLPPLLGLVYVVAYGAAIVWTLATDRLACGMFLAIGLPAVPVVFSRMNAGVRFSALLVTGAMLIGAVMELVFLIDGLEGGDWYRMNTVFKFYNQVWIMGGIGAAGLVVLMAREAWEAQRLPVPMTPAVEGDARSDLDDVEAVVPPLALLPDDQPAAPPTFEGSGGGFSGNGSWARIGLVVTALAMLASFAYPVLTTGARLQQRYPQDGANLTLNALDWMEYGQQQPPGVPPVSLSYDEDREVIDWFNAEVAGTPIIVEASLSQYMCGTARISTYTGLPSVIGWPWHEVQQRDWIDIHERQDQVRLLYTSTDPLVKQGVLSRYAVDYIVVGDLERYYPAANCTVTDNAAGVAAFEEMVAAGNLEVAFEAGETRVYRVISAG